MLSLKANILHMKLKYLPFLLLQAWNLTVHASTAQKFTRKLYFHRVSNVNFQFKCYSEKNYVDLLGETPVYYIFNCASVIKVKRNHRCLGDLF